MSISYNKGMTTYTLVREDQWQKIYQFLQSCKNIYAGNETKTRLFIEAIAWIARSGAQWRLLPGRFGNWNSVYKRFAGWNEKGIWRMMHAHFAVDPDMEWNFLDSTIIRSHPCAAGAPEARGGQEEQALGRSVGGFSTKIHINVDALGNPLRFILTGGQSHDITQAEGLIEGLDAEKVIADKSYDADDFITVIIGNGAEPVIPPRSNRNNQRDYDKYLYKARHLVECFINKIKHYRRIFSRFDKLAVRYLGFLSFVSALIWLR